MKNRILVVDDNINLTTLLDKTLTRFGYEVSVENDSSFALDTTRRVRPHVILLDVMMPYRDGGRVLQDLRNDTDLRSIPVILLTGIAREAQGLARTGGIQSVVLSKPVEIRTLLTELEDHIESSKTFGDRWAGRDSSGPGEPGDDGAREMRSLAQGMREEGSGTADRREEDRPVSGRSFSFPEFPRREQSPPFAIRPWAGDKEDGEGSDLPR